MGALVWIMVGLAIWHFTVFLPDRFAGGIVGAFLGALIGSFAFGVIVNAGSIPGRHDTDLLTGVEAIPGAVIGLAVVYFMGIRAERAQGTGPAGLAR
jgi:hypothetical protein